LNKKSSGSGLENRD